MLRVLHPTNATRSYGRRVGWAGRDSMKRLQGCQRRPFLNLPNVLVPPAVFGGLFVALWTWKCMMMIVFQNKIIYMPGLPPNSRWETIGDYKNQCQGIQWREERIRSLDGTRISLCVASVTTGSSVAKERAKKNVHVLYFQGNASSLPPRLPFLSPILRILRDGTTVREPTTFTVVCCSYRGYWTSRGRPSEKGIAMDAAAALQWINDKCRSERDPKDAHTRMPVVIWGQSIGAGVATTLVAEHELQSSGGLSLKTLILETPFLSIRAMLDTIYPQKWLPYKYLWPFLRNHLDSPKALGTIQERYLTAGLPPPNVVILEAGRDELVPRKHGNMLEKTCQDLGLEVTRKVIDHAYHTEVLARPGGIAAVVEILGNIANEGTYGGVAKSESTR